MHKGSKREYLLKGFRKSFIYSLGAAVALAVIAIVYSLVKSRSILQSMAYSFYYFGAFALIFSIPQLFRRNEDAKLKRIRGMDPFRINENPYEEEAALERYKEIKGDGFWSGMFIVLFSLFLFFYGFIVEKIYYWARG